MASRTNRLPQHPLERSTAGAGESFHNASSVAVQGSKYTWLSAEACVDCRGPMGFQSDIELIPGFDVERKCTEDSGSKARTS